MKFMHLALTVAGEALAIVHLEHQANVMVLTEMNYEAYREGRLFLYEDGGWSTRTPARLLIPSAGTWHIIVDFFGAPGHISASMQVLERSSKDPALRRRKTDPTPFPKVSRAKMFVERGQPSQAAIRRRQMIAERERVLWQDSSSRMSRQPTNAEVATANKTNVTKRKRTARTAKVIKAPAMAKPDRTDGTVKTVKTVKTAKTSRARTTKRTQRRGD